MFVMYFHVGYHADSFPLSLSLSLSQQRGRDAHGTPIVVAGDDSRAVTHVHLDVHG